jgi:hypothetical protein
VCLQTFALQAHLSEVFVTPVWSIKALALGASAICLGRPYVYGLAIAGEHGAREVIQNILAEFDLTMAPCRVYDVGRGRSRCSGKSRVDRYRTSAKKGFVWTKIGMNRASVI